MPSKNNILTEKLNHALAINNNLRKQIKELSDQNKQLSTSREILSLDNLSLQTEINSIRSFNVQLTEMHDKMIKKMSALEQTIQSCIVPALGTLSQWIPSISESIDQMSKFEIKKFNKENKEKQTNTVRPMIKGKTVFIRPVLRLKRCDNMLPSIESPITEQPQYSTRQLRHSTKQATLKSLKAIPNKKGPQSQLNENLGEGPSYLYAPENQIQNSNNSTNAIQNFQSSPRSTMVNEVQFGVTTIASTSSGITYNTIIDENEERQSDSSMIRNVTCQKRTRRSSESSSASDIDDSTSS